MRKSINASLELLVETALLNKNTVRFFNECCADGRYSGMQEVQEMAILTKSGTLLESSVEITFPYGDIGRCLQGVLRKASKAQDEETAAEAYSLLCQLVTLEGKIGGKK